MQIDPKVLGRAGLGVENIPIFAAMLVPNLKGRKKS